MVIINVLIFMFISGILGLIIGAVTKYIIIEKDETIEEVYKMLPGYNCGSCGKAGCHDFAECLIKENESVDRCKPCKKEQKDKILNYLRVNKNI